ncbi:MAG: hypothetical protein AB7F86_02360 [Bdellovibrionales bacterium]
MAHATYSDEVQSLMMASSCSSYSWKNRGRAPSGYMKGMALSYARSLCRYYLGDSPNPLAQLMARAAASSPSKDALAHYRSQFQSKSMSIEKAGPNVLISLYTLTTGLGMRESSGEYCEGWDRSAGSNRPSSEAEAGTFQFSYNSIGASSLLRDLYDEYQANPARCRLAEFKQGVSCKAQSVLGSGAGARFQEFTKKCPAFAAEYAATLLRLLRAHFGPINRREAELNSACYQVYTRIGSLIASDTQAVCEELF